MFGRALATVDNKAQLKTGKYEAQRFIRMVKTWRGVWISCGRPTASHSDAMKKFKLVACLGMEDPAFMTKLEHGQLSTRIKVQWCIVAADVSFGNLCCGRSSE